MPAKAPMKTASALAPLLLAACAAIAGASRPGPAGFSVETLAPGIHALTRTKAPGFFLDSNVLFVINDEDVLVVDANLTPSSAEASIAALRKLTPKPVRYLVNTHRHHDHVGGNEVYRREFPGVEILGSAAMAADFESFGKATMDGWTGWAAEMAAEIPQRLASGQGFSGQPLSAEERASLEGDLAAAQALVADAPRMRILEPTLTVTDRLTLHRAFRSQVRTIEILALGKGHTRGDLVVWLPQEGIAATGDLLVAPVPLIGGDQSYVEEWIGTFDRLRALGATTYLPGHGAVQKGDAQLLLYRDFLLSVVEQTRAAMAKGLTAEEAAGAVDVAPFRDRMAGENPVLRMLFANWGRVPAVAALYRVRDEAKSAQP
ncbi:MAG: MBL fold metallo-hydrolase [Thermoanaerobaculia bacterium]|nr:MBL fold metallo-hydrolase [Thermoanaerobaculia bacterium]